MPSMIPDVPGAFIGWLSIVILMLLYKYSEQFADGNVGGSDD